MKKSLVLLSLIFLISSAGIQAQQKDPTHSDSLDITHYAIHLRITDFAGKTISGYTEISALPKFPGLKFMRLDLLALTIDSIVLNGALTSAYTYNDTLIKISLTPPLNTSDTLKAIIYYHGFPQQDPGTNGWGGFKWSGNQAYNLGVGFVSDPHAFGRCWFPCIDDFVDKAQYDYYITVDSALNHTAVCGGMLQGITENGNGTRTCHWKQTEEIPSYLASVAVAEYVCVSDTFDAINGPIPCDIWVNPWDSAKVWTSFPKLEEIFHSFESRFGPYMFCRVGYVTVPFNSGAMEHASNIAYPTFCMTGTNAYETLYGHELSHHWFGDLITCSTALDMWINEGWATYSESVYMEDLYSVQTAKDYRRNAHSTNVRYNHIEEGDYYALYGIPHHLTYGTTVYEKGGMVAHTLRGHMGDSLFFSSVRQFLDSMKFKSVSSFEMRDILSDISGIDLDGFFDSWVFTPGFPHFSVDSFITTPNGPNYDVTVFLKEKLRGRNTYSHNLRFEIGFMNEQWQRYTVITTFDGPSCSRTFTLPFAPEIVMVDPEERTADASVDLYKTLNNVQTYDFSKTFFTATVEQITDSAFVRVEHNYVAPDPLKTFIPGLFISTERYWNIEGIFPDSIRIKGKFSYNKTTTTSGYLDNALITNVADSLVLFYRPSAAYDWQIVPTTRTGNNSAGFLYTSTTPPGQYTLGIWDWNRYLSSPDYKQQPAGIEIFPNPASASVFIKTENACQIKILNNRGVVVLAEQTSRNGLIQQDISSLLPGLYIVVVTDCNGKSKTARFIKESR